MYLPIPADGKRSGTKSAMKTWFVHFSSIVLVLLGSCKKDNSTAPEMLLPTRIVHTHGRGSDPLNPQSDLYVLDQAGNDRVLVDSMGINNFPKWSPDGRRIVFQGNRGRPTEIYLINADGSGERNLSNDPDFDEHPIWSPDGGKILFRGLRNGDFDLWVVDTNGQNLRNITPFNLRDDQPSWASNGRIAYVGLREGNREIYVTDPMGLNHEKVTNTLSENEYVPSWSPDGSTIAYTLNGQLYTIAFPGGVRRQLTSQQDSVVNSQPQWSPDGNNILYQTKSDEIWRVNSNGSNPVNLTSNPARDSYPRWSSDGSSIAFESYRSGDVQIFLMTRDGSRVQQLTSSANGNAMPEWAPR